MNHYVETYGKQLIKEVLDIILIKKKISDAEALELVKKYNLVSNRTRTVHVTIQGNKAWGVPGNIYKLNIENARYNSVLYIAILEKELQNVLEDCKDEVSTNNK